MIGEMLRNINSNRHILWRMSVSQLKVKYSGSIMGVSWAILNPLLIMFAITFVFTVILKIGIKNFSFFALAGIFPWMFFSNAIFESAFSILKQQGILHQFNLPREFIPLSSILANFLNFLIGWCAVYPVFLLYNPKIISLFPCLLLIIILNLVFVIGLGLMLSVLNVFFKDIGHLLNVLLMFWFWSTPIFYSLDMVPANFRWVFSANPMTYYIVSYKDVLFRGSVPDVFMLLGVLLWAGVSIILGMIVFSYSKNNLLKRI